MAALISNLWKPGRSCYEADMKSMCLVFALALAAAGAEKIPPDAAAIAKVAAGQTQEARALWWGFDPADATAALQAAINSGARKLIVENLGAPWVVNKLYLADNQELVFEPGVVVQAKRGAFHGTGDCLFTATLKTNVTLTGRGAILKMWKSDYDDKTQYEHAEWRHVLAFKSCSRVRVTGLTLADSGGDGIYLGVGRCGVPCADVIIRDVVCTNNYRQGISVISARDLLLENCTLVDTWGTAPQAGIDFEPNLDAEELVNCVMRNCISANNRGDAYTFYLKHLRKASKPISIRLENCRAEGSRRSLAFVTGNDGEAAAVGGAMEFVDCTFNGSQGAGLTIGNKPASGARVSFRNCTVSHAATNQPALAPIQLASSADAVEDFGALQFERLTVRDPLGRLPPLAYHDSSGGAGLRDIGGSLLLQRSNETAKVIQLTPTLLAEWLPHTSFKSFPRFAVEGVRYEPALPQVQPDAKARSMARQRGPSEWLLWAEVGKPARFTIRIAPVGPAKPKPAPVKLVAPSGAEAELTDTLPGAGDTAYEFQPKETGAYTIRVAPRIGTATVNSSGGRVCLLAQRAKLHLLGTRGEFFFWVPAGTREFAVKVAGDSPGERVKAALRDPAGKVVAEADDIVTARQFAASPLQATEGESWSLLLDKPATGVLEDFFIHLQGIPPVLAPTKAALLKPAK
jgi:hypothetical protein